MPTCRIPSTRSSASCSASPALSPTSSSSTIRRRAERAPDGTCPTMHWTEIATRRVDDVTIVNLHGQITPSADETPLLVRHVRREVEGGARKVLLNLTHVSYIDSTGIGEIVG